MTKKKQRKVRKISPVRATTSTLIQLCSMIVHYEEFVSDDGHPADLDAARGIRETPEIKKLFENLEKQALLPVKR